MANDPNSALDPKGSAQPSLNQAYTTPGNPASKEPAEQAEAAQNAATNTTKTDKRVPTEQSNSQEDAKPSALAQGVHGAPPGEEAGGHDHDDMGRHKELDAQQMAAPGEGDVYQAVEGQGGKTGTGGKQPGMESELDRKKAEQAPMREAVKKKKQHDVDVGGVLGQRGGPANPVDKDNYPNSDKQ